MNSRRRSALLAAAAVTLACGGALAAQASSAPVVDAPAGTAAQAGAAAQAALARIRLPAGSVRLDAAPRALSGAAEPNFTMPYVTFRTATAYWSLEDADAVSSLLAQAPSGSSTWSGFRGGERGAQIMLASPGGWMGPRWVLIDAEGDPGAAGRWLAEIQAVAVWTPSRLVLPGGVAAISVRRQQDGALLAHVTGAAEIRQIVGAVDSLAVDDAVHALYACPALRSDERPGFALSFADASGAVLATARTEWCPEDLSLEVGAHGPQQLILGDLRAQLGRILGITLPAAF